MMPLSLGLSLSSVRGGGAAAPNYLDFIWYGQSNSLNHIGQVNSPPAAASGTQLWDPATGAWITPTGNGIREFLNAMTAATGRPCRAVYGGQSGVNIAALQKGAGTGYYETLMGRITASGANPSFICFHHGEGDANTASPTLAGYQGSMDLLHGSIAGDLGKTRATLPMVISSLATVDATWTQPDSSWQTIKNAQATANDNYANIHYSHSNMDATLLDSVHWDGASYGRSGKRYARTILALMGSISTRPKWFATAAERVSTTTTRITVAHAMGSDFTPTSGITGFELTGNNGVSWVSATGAREDATHILLTHADLGTTERKIRYHYGKAPNITAPVLDNSSLVNLLNFTMTDLTAAGAAVLPTITYASSGTSTNSSATQVRTGVTVPGSSEALLAIIGHAVVSGVSHSSCSVTAQPSGTVIAATLVVQSGSLTPSAAIFQAQLPSGTTSIDVTVNLSANPFQNGRIHVATIPVSQLSSTTKVGSGSQRTASSLTSTTTLATAAGGVIFAVGADSSVTAGNTGAISGTKSYVTRNSALAAGGTHVVGDASNVDDDAESSVTVTFGNASNTTVIAASWR